MPTGMEAFAAENLPDLRRQLEDVWRRLMDKGIDQSQLLRQSMLSPATCCLVNEDKTRTVERAFAAVQTLSRELRQDYDQLLH